MIVWNNERTGLWVRMPIRVWHKIIKLNNKTYPNECGGILIGNYDKTLKEARIKDIFFSKHNIFERTSLLREAKEANIFLRLIWRLSCGNKYFIGEWHSHPNSNCGPSSIDDNAMYKIAIEQNCQCSRPILIILNGDKFKGWKAEKIWVYTKEGSKVELRHNSKC